MPLVPRGVPLVPYPASSCGDPIPSPPQAQFGPVSLAPLYIGFTVLVAHLVMIPVDGCSINPARSFGPAVISNSWQVCQHPWYPVWYP